MMARIDASDLAHRLGRQAEAVWRATRCTGRRPSWRAMSIMW